MLIDDILKDKKNSILLSIPGSDNGIVIGVPHHAPQGVMELPCEEHRVSDENAGFIGAALAGLLNCPAVIACNYFMDVNKHKSSDYYKKIQFLEPKILTEIHGHSRNKAHFDIEISSGSLERNYLSKKLAEKLCSRFLKETLLQGYTISGDFKEIYFRATKSLSITSRQWIAFHIELPRPIRAFSDQYFLFCELLAGSLREILAELDDLQRSQT